VGDLDDVINNWHKVCTERAKLDNGEWIDGFDDFMKEAGEQDTKAKGAALTLRIMADDTEWDFMKMGGYEFAGFEGEIPDILSGHMLDLKFTKGTPPNQMIRSVEMKNWASANSMSGNGQWNAYLISVQGNSGINNDFLYYFPDDIKDAMKQKFANDIKARVNANGGQEFFDSHLAFLSKSGISEYEDFIELSNSANFKNNSLFDFVR